MNKSSNKRSGNSLIETDPMGLRFWQIGTALAVASSVAVGQSWLPTVSNVLRYGSGDRGAGGTGGTFSYFENLTDVRARVFPSLTVGGRLLFDVPPEVGDRFKGISRRYVEYRDYGFRLRAGNSSALFGHGLTLNTFENRGLAFDTWFDGFLGEYDGGAVSTTFLAGSIHFRDSVTVTRYEDYTLYGGAGTFRPVRGIEAGLTFVHASGTIPRFVGSDTIEADLPGVTFAVRSGAIQLTAGMGWKRTRVAGASADASGSGVYLSASYSGSGFGITWDYKDYRFDIRDPFDRLDETRPTRMLPFQNPPTAIHEHSYALLTRQIHEVDFNDEVGTQVEAFAALNDATSITVNFSLASRHDAFAYSAATFTFSREHRSNNFLPSLEARYSPYWELFAEIEHFTETGISVRGGVARRANTLFNEFSGAAFSHIQRTTTIPVEVIIPLGDAISIEVRSENEWSFDSYVGPDPRAYTQYLTLILARSPDVSFSARYEHTTNLTDPSGRTDWLVGEVGYTFRGAQSVTVSYGRERGGLVCSNGVCLYRLPFKGVRFALRNRF